MMAAPIVAVVVVLVFAGASFFFSLAETSLFSLSKWQVRQLAERQPRTGNAVARLLAEPQDLLATMVLGNTFASAAMLAVALWMALNRHWPLAVTIVGLLALILIGCEVLPKTMAVRKPEQWALRVARLLALFQKVSLPLCRVAQHLNVAIIRGAVPRATQPQLALTDADYQELLEMAYQQGTLAQAEKEIILQIINLDRRAAKEVMRPRSLMAAISDDLSVEEMLAAARKFQHRRLPIYDESPDNIIGILNTRALLLDPHIDLADAIELPSFVPETMNLLQLLKSLQRQQRGLAIVLDEFGGTAGIVTMEDLLEEIFGEIQDEYDTEEFEEKKLSEDEFLFSGRLELDYINEKYGLNLPSDHAETLSGLIISEHEKIPKVKERIIFGNYEFDIMSVSDTRIEMVRVKILK